MDRQGLQRMLRRRRGAYRALFRGKDAGFVLADLAKFCHAHTTTHCVGDPTGSAQLEGRRQVWLRLRAQLDLTDEEFTSMLDRLE